jgi:hypothetical protein
MERPLLRTLLRAIKAYFLVDIFMKWCLCLAAQTPGFYFAVYIGGPVSPLWDNFLGCIASGIDRNKNQNERRL